MTEFEIDFKKRPYSLCADEKDKTLTNQLLELTKFHREHCLPYRNMLNATGFNERKIEHYSQLPFLPVGIFKKMRLSSLEDGDSFKSVTSSGTSGQARSQIILDGETRTLQQMALASIGNDFLGGHRMPMLVIDCEATVKKRDHFSARTSGILGFSLFGTHRTFALNEDMSLNEEIVEGFLQKYGDKDFLIFGFTFIVWQHLCLALEKRGRKFDFSHGILIHGGGWKKLISQSVSHEEYKRRLNEVCSLDRVHDYYGMAEQTGSIFMQCECGHYHASDYSAVLLRRGKDFSLCDLGEKGIIQVLSALPKSYPGHSLLTEDEGILLGIDNCPCGRKGAYFKVYGRLKNAELRGCSDTYAADFR